MESKAQNIAFTSSKWREEAGIAEPTNDNVVSSRDKRYDWEIWLSNEKIPVSQPDLPRIWGVNMGRQRGGEE
jgi:hypothetical protein